MKMKFTIILIICALGILACKKQNDNCQSEEFTSAFILDAPDTVQVDTPFNLVINYVVDNSCGSKIEYEAARYYNTLEVKLKTIYIGCDCEDGFVEKTSVYPIIFDLPGTYELKFWVSENDYESYVVVAE